MASLILKFKDRIQADFPLERGVSLRIGRRKDNDIVIENLAVSGYHAKIESIGEEFVLIDLQSKNGCFVNEQLVNSHWLKNGDVISIGKHSLEFSGHRPASQTEDPNDEIAQTMVMDTSRYRSMIKKSAPNYPSHFKRRKKTVAVVTYLTGGEGRLVLKNKLIKIGRDDTADIKIKGLTLGRFAATISKRSDGYHISFVGGMARPRVNEEPIAQNQLLNDMDIIEIGPAKLQFSLKTISG